MRALRARAWRHTVERGSEMQSVGKPGRLEVAKPRVAKSSWSTGLSCRIDGWLGNTTCNYHVTSAGKKQSDQDGPPHPAGYPQYAFCRDFAHAFLLSENPPRASRNSFSAPPALVAEVEGRPGRKRSMVS